MSKRVIVDAAQQQVREEDIPQGEQTEIDAMQAAATAQRQANDTARAAVVYGADAVDITNMDVIKQYVQASRANINKANRTQADLEAQVDRNTRAILALLRKLV